MNQRPGFGLAGYGLTEFGPDAASRLLAELMPVAVLIAGATEDATAMAVLLQDAGAAADVLVPGQVADGYDLAILLAPVDAAGTPASAEAVGALSAACGRLLFVPAGGPAGASDLTTWVELFVELGYQPVVDFDAGFVAEGAFLVDRQATAAESELADFAERLVAGPAAMPTPSPPPPDTDHILQRLRGDLAARDQELAELRDQIVLLKAASAAQAAKAAQAQAQIHALVAQNAGWDALRTWVRVRAARDSPPIAVVSPPPAPRRPAQASPALRLWRRLFPRRTDRGADDAAQAVAQEQSLRHASLMASAALIRTAEWFDAAWYIASNADAAEEGADPAVHYLTVGAPRGADPGPNFDSSAYLSEHPDAAARGVPALLHALQQYRSETDRPPDQKSR